MRLVYYQYLLAISLFSKFDIIISMKNHTDISLSVQRDLIKSRKTSSKDLASKCLTQIKNLNSTLNAFITVTPPKKDLKPEGSTPLYGLPIAIKDLIDTQGIRTTYGTRFFNNHVPNEDAFVVKKIKQAGAQIIGKVNLHEVALGLTSNNPHYGTCRNPWDFTRTPGGSSGGSAVAVATGMALAALGTDTGGSIRVPAALCGVVGLKPTYGRVSLGGIMPLSWNLDHAGPITRKVEDAALMLQVMSGYDENDPVSIKTLPGDYSSHIQDGMQDRKVALAIGIYIEDSDYEVYQAVRVAAYALKKLGVSVEEVNMDFLHDAWEAARTILHVDAATFHKERLIEHPDWFGDDVRARLMIGMNTTANDYSLARRAGMKARRKLDELFELFDVLLLPTTPIAAPEIEGENALERAAQLTRFTNPFNVTGLPALSVPCGFTSEGLPIGLQIVSRAWNEAGVLRAGYAYQELTDWHTKRPEPTPSS